MKFGAYIVAMFAENKEMIVQTVMDITLRGFSGFTGGLLSEMSVDGIVALCNREKGAFKLFCRGFKKENR